MHESEPGLTSAVRGTLSDIVTTAQLAPGGQVALPLTIAGQLRLRDGRPASLLQVELREGGVFLRPLEPRDLPVETMGSWVAEGEAEMREFRKDAV